MATETSPLRSTSARAVSSPRFSRDGLGMPMPPETGRSFSGVITRTAAPGLDLGTSRGQLRTARRRRRTRRAIVASWSVSPGEDRVGPIARPHRPG